MPETRYIEVYDNHGNIIALEPYEVSDEQLAEEAERATIEGYLAQSPPAITMPQLWAVIRHLARRAGLKSP